MNPAPAVGALAPLAAAAGGGPLEGAAGILLALALASAAFGVLFAAASLAAAWRLRAARSGRGAAGPLPSVTVLKPIKGTDGGMYENLASFLRQDYPRLQVLFTLQSPEDPALPILHRLREEHPSADMEIIVSKARIGYNPKVNNLSNAAAFIKHDLLVISDSDVRVGPDFLSRAVAPLADPRVGLVTCFYRCPASRSLGGALDALSVNAQFLPQALVAGLLGGLRFSMGAAMLVRRDAFEAVGGFPSLSHHLADDYVLGSLVAGAGWKVEFSDVVVESIPGEPSLAEHFAHLARWTRTIRACQPAGYAGLAALHGLAWLALHAVLFGPRPATVAAAAVLAAVRIAATAGLHRILGPAPGLSVQALLTPLADLVQFMAWVAGFRSRTVLWRGERYHIAVGGRLVPAKRRSRPAAATAV